jgi:ABC-type transport system involved in multi-copper enzyme maturation permease subunit
VLFISSVWCVSEVFFFGLVLAWYLIPFGPSREFTSALLGTDLFNSEQKSGTHFLYIDRAEMFQIVRFC